MPPSSSNSTSKVHELTRQQFLEMISVAETLNENTFARQITAFWLSTYPGDLQFKNLYAKLLLVEGQAHTARSIIEEVIQVDPEYLEAAITRLKIARFSSGDNRVMHSSVSHPPGTGLSDLIEWKNALQVNSENHVAKKQALGENHWGATIKQLNNTIHNDSINNPFPEKLDDIEAVLFSLLAKKPDLPIIAIAHLRILKNKSKSGKAPAQALNSLAEHYFSLFPNCQYCCLTFVECLMEGLDTDRAVSLLHSCVSQDITGQVATRMWGDNHPYRNLWPYHLSLKLEIPIPAAVAGYFGWNQLDPGIAPQSADSSPESLELGNALSDTQAATPIHTNQPDQNISINIKDFEANEKHSDELNDVRKELERLSKHIKQPDLMNADGRIPTYVILTTQRGLINAYGRHRANQIEQEILNLVTVIRNKKNWNAVLFYPDLGVLMPSGKVVTKPAQYNDPWAIKLSLSDLDDLLAGYGEMIGAVLLLGGPVVVPFHHLPNPIDDADEDVPSDNPYATKDTNYFIPSWPVGRLPDGTGEDGSFILRSLQEYTANHKLSLHYPSTNKKYLYQRILSWLQSVLNRNHQHFGSFGYTAAAWREASYEVFRPIGDAKKMLVSPPLKESKRRKNQNSLIQRYWQRSFVTKALPGMRDKSPTGLTPGIYIPAAQFSYFNLHGLANAVDWYGQSDIFSQDSNEIDYPVALKPIDIGSAGQKAPWLVFTEACYGAHILNKKVAEAMAFQFMQRGCLAYVGSTCVSYGSLNPPLSAADFLGNAFWSAIRQGFPAGESLCRAKISLAREMNQKQGYLDGEDQKTLISFILLGDPLAQNHTIKPLAKSGFRKRSAIKYSHSPCDHNHLPPVNQKLTLEETRQIKHILKRYLPGMQDAHLTLRTEQVSNCQICRFNCGKNLSTGDSKQSNITDMDSYSGLPNTGKKVVILSKRSDEPPNHHIQYARLTLDDRGKLVKLVVSR